METKTKPQHTPTPWTNVKTEVGVYSDDFLVGEIGTFTPTDRAFIVCAVNSHEALLETCKNLIHDLEFAGQKVSPFVKEIIALAEK